MNTYRIIRVIGTDGADVGRYYDAVSHRAAVASLHWKHVVNIVEVNRDDEHDYYDVQDIHDGSMKYFKVSYA